LLVAIDRYCKELGIDWTASCWDEAAIDFDGIKRLYDSELGPRKKLRRVR
jgi:hypothetical protein